MDPKTPSFPKDTEEKDTAMDANTMTPEAEAKSTDGAAGGVDPLRADGDESALRESSATSSNESTDTEPKTDIAGDVSSGASDAPSATPEGPASPVDDSAPAAADTPLAETPADVAGPVEPLSPPPSTSDTTNIGGMAAGSAVAGGMVDAPAGKKKTGMIVAIVAVVVVMLLAGAAAAAYYVMNKPQNVLGMALSNAFSKTKAKSVAFEGALTATDSNKKQVLGVTYTGAADQEGALQIDASVDAVVTTVTVGLRTQDASTYYLKVGGLNGLPQLLGASNQAEAKALAPIIAAVNNQWFEMSPSLIKQLNGGKDLSTKLSDADRQKIVEAYKKNQFLIVKKTLPDEAIKGVASHHYQVGIDKATLQHFVMALKNAKLDSFTISSSQYDSLITSIGESKVDSYPVDMWIAKSSRMIDQVALSSTDSDGVTATIRFTVSSYNKPVQVDKPAGTKSLLDVLGQLFGGGSAGGGTVNPLEMFSGFSL